MNKDPIKLTKKEQLIVYKHNLEEVIREYKEELDKVEKILKKERKE